MFNSKENLDVIKRALEMVIEEEVASQPTLEEVKDVSFSKEFERKMQKLIRAQSRPYYRLINSAGKRVACLIIALLIALTSVTFGVEAIREKVIDFFVETYEKFSMVFFAEEDIPEDAEFIETYYAPTYIPEGYELQKSNKLLAYYNIKYAKDDNTIIYYTQNTIVTNYSYIDTENANTEDIEIGRYSGYMSYKDNSIVIFWNNPNYIFSISVDGSISRDELIKIAISVMPE